MMTLSKYSKVDAATATGAAMLFLQDDDDDDEALLIKPTMEMPPIREWTLPRTLPLLS